MSAKRFDCQGSSGYMSESEPGHYWGVYDNEYRATIDAQLLVEDMGYEGIEVQK